MRRDVLETLRRLGKSYYTVADLRKVTGLTNGSLRVFLTRWTAAGWLERIGSGMYRLPERPLDPAEVANQRYLPSYLSFESALSRYGILSQVPFTLTFATSRRSRRMSLKAADIEFRQIRPDLFGGYQMEQSIFIATPEKALLDQLYFVSLGRATLNLSELNLKPVNQRILTKLSRPFPARTRQLLKQLPFVV